MTEADRQLAYIEAELQKDREPADAAMLAKRRTEILKRRAHAEKKMMY